VLSSSSSTYATLWRAASCSSINTTLTRTAGAANNLDRDGVIEQYEHEDTIYSLDWSAAEAWVFATLSYNGVFYIHNVPTEEKYKIII